MSKVDFLVRENLSVSGQNLFDDVAYQRVLGASTHIRMISEMILDLCAEAESQNKSAREIVKDIHQLSNFFKNTRGEASQAISNAIHLMISGIDRIENDDQQILIDQVKKNIEEFRQTNANNLDAINRFAIELISEMDTILLFDYSSTVGRMVETSKNKMRVFIPESRVLNGGKPFIEKCQKGNHKIHFIPDAAIFYYLRGCDAVFIGSETLYPDGRAFNTVGSEMVASLCKISGVPFYVLTTLLKMDMRPLRGYQKPPVIIDLSKKYADVMENTFTSFIDFSCPELVEIPAENITALITEAGIVPPTAIFQLAREYSDKIREI
jgi:ribose 1,5-bisphosphate isomerase